MCRRRKLVPVTMITIGVFLDTLEQINQYKQTKATQDQFIKRILIEWKYAREMIKVMELVEQYKNKRIEKYDTELRHCHYRETQQYRNYASHLFNYLLSLFFFQFYKSVNLRS